MPGEQVDDLASALMLGQRGRGLLFDTPRLTTGHPASDNGVKPPFLRELDALGQNYVAEVPRSFRVWTKRPDVLYREHDRDRRMGRPPKLPRLKVKNNPPCEVGRW